MPSSRELHIAPGGSAAGCIKQALNLSPGELLVSDDLLSCGPLIPLRNLDEWRRLREEYLGTLFPSHGFSFAEAPYDLLSNADSLREAESITLWLGTGLEEQLLLVWVPQLFRLLNVDLKKLRIIQFSRDPIKDEEIQGIGLLNPERLKAHPAATSLDEEALASLDRAWSAVTASTPSLLVAFLAAEPGPLHFLQRSLRWLLFRLPDVESGLNLWEFELLRQVAEKGQRPSRLSDSLLFAGWRAWITWVVTIYSRA